MGRLRGPEGERRYHSESRETSYFSAQNSVLGRIPASDEPLQRRGEPGGLTAGHGSI
jgi:hypothetical protein